MFCSTCGTPIPSGRRTCPGCGSPVAGLSLGAGSEGGRGHPAERSTVAQVRGHVCPRCGYHGEGIGYFSRGSRVAALIGITMLTMGAMGAGGLIFYLVRRDHLACPRCGRSWGKEGERALVRSTSGRQVEPETPAVPAESWKRVWSIVLFVFAALMMLGGLIEGEVGLVAGALFTAGGGALLHQAAAREREQRREALISALQLPVLKLAARHGGRLTVTEVAANLGWPLRRAEKILQSLDDGLRVDSEVTDEGVIVYDFLELSRGGSGPELRLREGNGA
jgi:hypothetical protein